MRQLNPVPPLAAGQRICGVTGWPAAHSLSPAIHRAAYAHLGLGWRYDAQEIPPDAFVPFVEGLDGRVWRGLSVTMPHKEAAASLGEGDADVRATGVANTLVWSGAERYAYNTDIAGFEGALAAAGVNAVSQGVVIGSGATARSAIVALARLGATRVDVLARNPEKARALADWASAMIGRTGVLPWTAAIPGDAEVLVCTLPAPAARDIVPSLGLTPSLRALFDVSYHPWPTPLALAGGSASVPVIDGLDLLAHQAVEQVRLMTGGEVAADVLLTAARTESDRRLRVPN